jgi:hypothetical protein
VRKSPVPLKRRACWRIEGDLFGETASGDDLRSERVRRRAITRVEEQKEASTYEARLAQPGGRFGVT